jgi:uncharacterized small protein (DUF1192 family)
MGPLGESVLVCRGEFALDDLQGVPQTRNGLELWPPQLVGLNFAAMELRTMMLNEEDGATPTRDIRIGDDLDLLSIEELQERIRLFETEIVRFRANIEEKQRTKTDAEAVFRK